MVSHLLTVDLILWIGCAFFEINGAVAIELVVLEASDLPTLRIMHLMLLAPTPPTLFPR